MRRLLLPAVLLVVLAFVPTASAGTLFVIDGAGWGHGVGMSQWGAYGRALDGKTHTEILTHYYRGTIIDRRSPSTPVKVLLADGRTSLSVGSASSFTVADGTKKRTHAADTSVAVTKTSTGRIKVQGIGVTFKSPATLSSASPLYLGAKRYRGKLIVSVAGGGLRAVNRVGIDNYVRGVVTQEALDWWGDVGAAAAISAQAVAARSYALFTVVRGAGKCAGYLCPDTRDQVYGGYDAETRNGNEAVDGTRGQVVEYNGAIAQTFFHSSSGGRTAASEDAFVTAVPYLRSESDTADLNADNPNRSWLVKLTARQMRSRLGLARTPNDGIAGRNGSDRVGSMTFYAPGWSQMVPGGDSLRWRLNVRSNRFWLGVLTLERRRSRIEYGRGTKLDAIVRGLSNVQLQRRPYGASGWTNVTAVSGTVAVTVRPRKTTSYRLKSSKANGPTVSIAVAVDVDFDLEQPVGALTGTVAPVSLAGTSVKVQKRVDGSWKTVATPTVNPDGTFRAEGIGAGTYRARVVPPSGTGLVTGTSATLSYSG